jgi:hypothetical protein
MRSTTINLTKSNRAIGLMAELADLIASEDSSLELSRIRATLESLSSEARHRAAVVEKETRQIAVAARKQTVSRKPASARIAKLMARC